MRTHVMHTIKRTAVLTAVSLTALVGATTLAGPASASPPHAATAAPSTSRITSPAPHIMTIVMENSDYSQKAGAFVAPYENELAHQYADFTNAYGWTYPSLPNYIELLAGSTVGISNDCDITDAGCNNLVHERIIDQFNATGTSWGFYYQGDPKGCDQSDANGGTTGNYPAYHDPLRYFADFTTQCSHIHNTDALLPALSSPSAPDFNWVVPDQVDSGGDNGTMTSGDNWLSSELPKIMATNWYKQGGQIVVLHDSGYQNANGIGGANGGHIPVYVVSARTKGMGVVSAPVTTAGILRSIEKAYGYPYIGDAANPANGSLGHALVAGRPTGPAAPQLFHGAMVGTGQHGAITTTGVRGNVLSLNGIYRYPNAKTIEVGQTTTGQGVVVTSGHAAVPVPGTSNLQSVSCVTAQTCYAVGIGPVNDDDAVIVKIVNGHPTKVMPNHPFIGLYGIACVSSTTCYGVGYDNNSDGSAVTTIINGAASPPNEVPNNGANSNLFSISCPTTSQCYAAGLLNYAPALVPITNGKPSAGLTVPNAWYLNGIDCTGVGDCVVVGENSTAQGTVTTLSSGVMGATQTVAGTGYLYGVGCAPDGTCVLAGTSSLSTTGIGTGVLARYYHGIGLPRTKSPTPTDSDKPSAASPPTPASASEQRTNPHKFDYTRRGSAAIAADPRPALSAREPGAAGRVGRAARPRRCPKTVFCTLISPRFLPRPVDVHLLAPARPSWPVGLPSVSEQLKSRRTDRMSKV